MEDELDLRAYIEAVLRGWKWVLAAGVVAGTAALVASLLMLPEYEAAALVIMTEPRYQMQLDPRFETTEGLLAPYEVFPALATSDDVLQDVLDGYTPSGAEADAWTLHGTVSTPQNALQSLQEKFLLYLCSVT